MLDLYKLHSNPEQLLWYNERYENPWLAWPLAEPAIAGPDKSGIPKFDWETYDYRYAEKVLKDPHPETWKERYWAEHQS